MEQAIGAVAAAYRTPLPMVLDMALCSIMAWFRNIPMVLPMVEPMAEFPTPKPNHVEQITELHRRMGVTSG